MLIGLDRLSFQLLATSMNEWKLGTQNSHLSSGEGYSVFKASDDTVWGFGERFFKRIDEHGRFVPFQVPIVENTTVIQAATEKVMCITTEGKVWEFSPEWAPRVGVSAWSQVPTLIPSLPAITTVSCGINHTVFVAEDTSVWGIGSNKQGQLGFGYRETVKEMQQIPDVNARAVYCGHTFTYLLSDNGTVHCAGWNICGQLGMGDKEDRRTFTELLPESNIASISCGEYHTLFLIDDGTVYSCGKSKVGALGLGDESTEALYPQRIVGLPLIKAITCSRHQSFCLDEEGQLWSFGNNRNGRLGFDDISDRNTPDRVQDIPPMSSLCTFSFVRVSNNVLKEDLEQNLLLTDVHGQLWSFPPSSGEQSFSPLQPVNPDFHE